MTEAPRTDGRILLNSGPSEHGWSRLSVAARCLRLYAFKYILKINHDDATALVRGSLVHIGLAHFYAQMRAVQQKSDPGRYYDPLEAMALVAPTFSLGPSLLPLCQKIVQQYMKWHAGDAVRFKVVAVEEQVRATLGGKYPFTQRWDLVLQDKSNLIWVMDHKCSAKPGPTTVVGHMLSGQFLGAQLIGKSMFKEQWGGVKINVLGAIEAPDGQFDYLRDNLPAAPGAVNRFRDDMVALEDRLAYLAANVDPWEYPGSWNELTCVHRYGVCSSMELCRWGRPVKDTAKESSNGNN